MDAYEHALLGRYPRARYVVGMDAKYIFGLLQVTSALFTTCTQLDCLYASVSLGLTYQEYELCAICDMVIHDMN